MREPVFRTRITELFGIRHPILAGGLMWLANADYVAAVVNAGGMGFLTARSFSDGPSFRAELERAWTLTGGKPFGVNVHLSVRADANRDLSTFAEIALELGVRHFETSGIPPARLIERMKEEGSTVIHKVSEVKHAESAVRKLPIDAVAVVGAECGGHPGLNMVGTMVQAALAARRLAVPLAVGGGIGTGEQLAACLAMGADGVIIGTRFLVARELWSDPAIKQRVIESRETDTRLVLAGMKNTYRCLDNDTARAVAALEAEGITDFEAYRPHVAGTLQRTAYESGDPELGILSLGQACVFAEAIESVEAIVDRLLEEAAGAGDRLRQLSAREREPPTPLAVAKIRWPR
jgi:NADH:quinone reductase (non-electrogenic)